MKLNENQKLFSKFIISLLEQMYDKHNNTLSELCDPVRNSNKEQLINQLSQIMFKYNIKDACMGISKVQQMKLYKELCSEINEMFGNEFNVEKDCISDILSQTAKDSYYINSFVTAMGISYTLKPVSNKILQEIINHKINGKLWNERLWEDKKNLRKDLKFKVKKFLNGEINVNNISDVIEKKYKNNRYVTNRLVNNEISIVQEGANDVWRKEHNIKNMLYMGTLDRHICSDCAQYDGKTYEVGKQPVDLPQHVGCRCTYVNIPSADWRPQERLDNETKERIDWQTYEEWYKNNSGKMSADKINDNIPKEGSLISEQDFKKFKNSIEKLGMRCDGFENYRGDITILNDLIQDLKTIKDTQPSIADMKNGLLIKYEDLGNISDFAISHKKSIVLNSRIYNDTNFMQKYYSECEAERFFVKGTNYRSVIYHEAGHILCSRNLRLQNELEGYIKEKAIESKLSMDEYILKNISQYATKKDFRTEKYIELLPEIMSMCYNNGNNKDIGNMILEKLKLR